MQLPQVQQLLNHGTVTRQWIGVGIVLLAARGLLYAAGWQHRRCARRGGEPESVRKLLHVGMGCLAMAYPWLFDRSWPVLLLSGVFIGLLGARHVCKPLHYHVAGVIYGVRRSSAGEYYFPLVTALLFLLARGDRLLYLIPLGLMVFADTAAALAGTRFGKFRYGPPTAPKTAEGSIAFFATAFCCGLLLFVLDGRADAFRAILVCLVLAQLATILEASLSRGLDNLLMPLAALAALQSLLQLTPLRLALCTAAVPIAAALAWAAWRASYFDSSGHSAKSERVLDR